jgi:hypothetical protein
MTEDSTKGARSAGTPEERRKRLVYGNSRALETAILAAIANGETPEAIVVLLLDLRDEWGGLLAKLIDAAGSDAALRSALPDGAVCFVVSEDRRVLAKLFANFSLELGEAVAVPPPQGAFSVLCVADGFEVFSGPLPLSGRTGNA